jgi:hypothetical protein
MNYKKTLLNVYFFINLFLFCNNLKNHSVMRKKIFFLTLLLSWLSIFQVFSQVPDYVWAKKQDDGGYSGEKIYEVATDKDGNIIAVGEFSSSYITFGSTTLSNENAFNKIFIVKFDPNGNVLWAKQQDGESDNSDVATAVTTDSHGNIIVVGHFKSSTLTMGTVTLTNANPGEYDVFIVKYDPDGNVILAKQQDGGGNDYDFATGITTDSNDNIIFIGKFKSDTIIFGNTSLINAGETNFFIVKYDSDGNVIWAKQQDGGGEGYNFAYGVATDNNNNIIVVGTFDTHITFGQTSLSNTQFGNDIFIVKYDSAGNVLWAKKQDDNGDKDDKTYGVATDLNNNIIVVGNFQSSIITFGSTHLINDGDYGNIFVVKYDPNGNAMWAKQQDGGGESEDIPHSVTTDSEGNIIVAGYFLSSSITFGSTTLTNADSESYDIFIVKYDSSGNVLWAKQQDGGGNDFDLAYTVATDSNDNIIVGGGFASSNIIFGSTTLPVLGSLDPFITKISTVSSTPLQKALTDKDVFISPNPINKELNVKSKKTIDEITLITINGEKVKSWEKVNNKNYKFDFSKLKKGAYIVKIKFSDGSIAIEKIIKK